MAPAAPRDPPGAQRRLPSAARGTTGTPPAPCTRTRPADRTRSPFEFDSAVIARDSYSVVLAVADALALYAHLRPIEIGGHTDSRGSAAYNLALSTSCAGER